MIENRGDTQASAAGIPKDLLPMWENWQLPSGRPRWVYKREDLETGTHDGLCLGKGKLLEDAWEHIPEQLMKLRYLVVEQHRIYPSTLNVISQLMSLERLYLTRVTTPDLQFLNNLTSLQYLCIEGISKVTDDARFARLDHLISLGLGTALQTLDPLARAYPNLRCLVLEGPGETKPARFRDLTAISELQDLEYLALLNCRTDDKRLTSLLELPHLKSVVIGSRRWWNSSDLDNLTAAGVHLSDFLDARGL